MNASILSAPLAPSDASGKVETRQRILVVSGALFSRWGYHGTSTRQIAAGVGIAQPSLFHHFASKQAIMDQLLQLTYLPPRIVLARLLVNEAPADVRLYAFMIDDFRYSTLLGINLSGTHHDDVLTDETFALWRAEADAFHAALTSLVEQGLAERRYVGIDPELARVAHTGISKEVLRLIGRGELPTEGDWPHQVAADFLRGLLRDRRRLRSLPAEAEKVLADTGTMLSLDVPIVR